MSQWHLLAMQSVSLSQTHLSTVSFFILMFLTYEAKTEGLSVSFSKARKVSRAQGKARTLKGNLMKMCSDIFLFSPRKRDGCVDSDWAGYIRQSEYGATILKGGNPRLNIPFSSATTALFINQRLMWELEQGFHS